MNVLKGIYYVIWIIIGLIVLAMMAGGGFFIVSGGLQAVGDAVGSQINNQVKSFGDSTQKGIESSIGNTTNQ